MSGRGPGRAGLTFEEVAETADRLIAEGKAVTQRSVRASLGAGSTATIQRHLARWRSRNHRVRVVTPLSVDASDVANLGPRDFALLINHLVRREIHQAGISVDPDTTGAVNVPDGGIDGAIQWDDGPERTAHLLGRSTIWQTKSGQLLGPSELLRDIERRDGTALKPKVAAHFSSGGAYVLFCAADMTLLQKSSRIEALATAVRRHLPNVEPHIAIVAGADIAAWASQDLWARTLLVKASGREHPSTLLSFEEWAQNAHLSNDFVSTDELSKIAENIRERVGETPGLTYRIDGAPGLGKTRLALEGLRPLLDHGGAIVYFDTRHAGLDAELLRAIANWKRSEVQGIVVVDNCSLQLHQQIVHTLASSQLSAITIGDRQESNADHTLRPLTNEDITKIVEAHPLKPQQPGAVTRIIQYAEGWPLMAIIVLQALKSGRQTLALLDDDELTRRLVAADPDSEPARVLKLLSLFDHVGWRDSVKDQIEYLRSHFASDIGHDKFIAHIRRFEKNGLVSAIGRYWRVTPSPLAIRLTKEWLDEASDAAQQRLFSTLPEELTEALARRLREITTPSSVALAQSLLDRGGRFGALEGILGTSNTQIFGALAEIAPKNASGVVRRTLASLTDERLRNIDETNGRQTLVFSLERLAFHRDCFQDAARALFALARCENSSYGNNASGTLVKLFRLRGSQTEAPPADRFSMLDEFMQREDDTSTRLVSSMLKGMLQMEFGWVTVGPESQGGRPPLNEWEPALWSDVFSYFHEAVTRTLLLGQRNKLGRELARDVISNAIPTLVRYGRWDDLADAIEGLKGDSWPKAVERLRWSIRHQLEDEDEAAQQRLSSLLASIMPTELADRIRIFVSEAPSELEKRSEQFVHVELERLADFARETIEEDVVEQVLAVLSTGHHRFPHAYSQAVAQTVHDLERLVTSAISAYVAAPEPRNDLPLVGIMLELASKDPSLRAKTLARIASDPRLFDALPAVATMPAADDLSTRLLIEYVRNARTNQPRTNLFYGRTFATVDETLVRELVMELLSRGWYESATQLLFFGVQESERFDDLIMRLILESQCISRKLQDVHEWSVFEAIRRLIRAGNHDFTLAIAQQLIDLALSGDASFSDRHRVSDLWADLLEHSAVFTRLQDRYDSLDRRDRWKLLIATQYMPEGTVEHRLALEVLPLDSLLAFAQRYPDDVPWFLAQYGELFWGGVQPLAAARLPESPMCVTPLLRGLLDEFGGRDDVLQNIDANLHSFMTVGSRAPYYAKRIELVDQIPDFGRPRLLAWKQQLRDDLERQEQRAKREDEEFQKGIF